MAEDFGAVLKQHGVILEGHFLLTSGRHSGFYFEKFRILEHPELCKIFARQIADKFRKDRITVVCGPTTGGVIIAYEVARQLGCRCIIAERTDNGRRIGRGFHIDEKDRVLVVDDVMTTGSSILQTLEALEQFPATVAGIAVFIDRNGGKGLDTPYFAVYEQRVEDYEPENCPLCKAGVPLQVPGRSGKTS
ncbi:orotate phosphoribosyltransferase [candidate division WOR-3 bacterium JGI_Cruoil_03_51_56]|uniref:Orotate phosphoribosyltransferase n=1 Tax=candidate division WOR-3 bacterium JGI_Cruoil_03_51_56 TaxID=1973747 RepID=A0A235BXS6_UNCW3|nr:MAG: orotate phosphoribosyltransferase [candidate division WOR-3 bacterium JGI_Cruoil_03_51_56]